MAEYDGIKEREEGKKKMPLGMTVLFMGLAVFGLTYIYLFLPHTTGWTQLTQYEQKVKEREAVKAKHGEVESAETEEHERSEALVRGEKIYKESCAACHGVHLEGGIGPGLLGPKFIYGDSVEDHIKVISKGTPKGMPGFERQLGATNIYNVAYYVHSHHSK